MNTDDNMPSLSSFSEENRNLVFSLREAGDEMLVDMLEDFGEADDEIAGELVGLVVGDRSEEVRSAAAIALGPTLELCEWELDDDGRLSADPGPYDDAPLSPAVYDRVLAALRQIHDDEDAPKLLRRRALEAAVRSPKRWHEVAARAAWLSGDPDWRVTAVFRMGFCRRADFSAEIEQAFRSGNDDLRREAALAAGQLELEHLRPEILAMAGDESCPDHVRYGAVQALGFIGGEEAAALLEDLAKSDDTTLAGLAEETLKQVLMLAKLDDLDDIDPEEDW